jgi:tetratricopeptide (TPR) repeat protein
MKLKLALLAFLLTGHIYSIYAQVETDGFAKLNQKDYNSAKQIFSGLLKKNAENAVAFYGLGECYFYSGRIDSAKSCYEKGIEANSSYACNYAGLGKVKLLSSPSEAESLFKDAVKKSKKDATALVAIAKTYYTQTPKNLNEAKRYIDLAIGVDPNNAGAFYMNGLIELDKGNHGEASLQIERAIYFDKNLYDAYFLQSDIMIAAQNMPQAIEYIKKVTVINPEYWIAYKKLGELYYGIQKYADAVTNFAIYYKNVANDVDITHYAYSLFFNKQFKEARELIDKLVQQNPNDYVLLRLLGYISYETKDLVNGKKIMDKFFTLIPADKILTDDYSYYGKMLSASGNDSLAIVNYQLALKSDSTQFQVYDEISRSLNKLKKYEEALKYSSKYFKKKPNLTPLDYFQLGKAYYSTGNNLDVKTDSLKQLGFYLVADSLFKQVETYTPNSYLGPFWRARTNSSIDKETSLGLAKPFYEKSLEILIKDPVKYKKELSEIYNYLGFYYYVKEDKQNSLDNWKKLLELDPENLKAQEVIKSLEAK